MHGDWVMVVQPSSNIMPANDNTMRPTATAMLCCSQNGHIQGAFYSHPASSIKGKAIAQKQSSHRRRALALL